MTQAHRALHPFGAEMQEAHAALFREGDRGETRLAAGRWQVALTVKAKVKAKVKFKV